MKHIYLLIVLLCTVNAQPVKGAFIVRQHKYNVMIASDRNMTLRPGVTNIAEAPLEGNFVRWNSGPRLHNRSSNTSRGGERGGGRHSSYHRSNNNGGSIAFGIFRILFSLFINTDRPRRERRERRQLPIVTQLIIFGTILILVLLLFSAASKK